MLIIVSAPAIWITTIGMNDDIKPCDVGIVLGSQVMEDGTPSDRLIGRLDRAVSLYRKKMIPKIIVSGGKGESGYEESSVMKEFLKNKGIPEADIIEDRWGVNTMATARNTADIMKTRNFHSAMVITQYFHIARTITALRAYGIGQIGHAHAQYYELRDAYSLLRESVALPVYLVKINIKDAPLPPKTTDKSANP